jgi:polyhydroxybutyrate depolymerase
MLKWLLSCLCFLCINIAPDRTYASTRSGGCDRQDFRQGTSDHPLSFGGLTRRYLLHIPPGYDPAQSTPLVFTLHGLGVTPELIESWSRLDEVSDQYGFIVVYPQGTNFPLRWNAGKSSRLTTYPADDVSYIRELISTLQRQLCVDPARIYASGYSNGGGMSNRLACEMSDTIAAIGTVAGAYSPVTCNPVRATPVIAFHGTSDPIVPYKGSPGNFLPPVEEWAKEWATRNGCELASQALPTNGDVSGIEYKNCQDNAAVILYTIDRGGHTWPGGKPIPLVGKTSQDINASETMWQFFSAHPLASAVTPAASHP